MKKTTLVVSLVLALTVPLRAQTTVEPRYLVVPGESVGPARLGMSMAEIRAALGREQRSQTDSRGVVYLNYSPPGTPGLRVELARDRAVTITAYLDPAYRTAGDLGVGSSGADVEKA